MVLVIEIGHGSSLGYIAANEDLHGLIAEKEVCFQASAKYSSPR